MDRFRDVLVDDNVDDNYVVFEAKSFTFPKSVDEGSAWGLIIPVESSDVGAYFFDVVYLREGSAVSALFTQAEVIPFDPDLLKKLVGVVAERMSDEEAL